MLGVNDSSYPSGPSGGSFGTRGIQNSDSPQPVAGQGTVDSLGAGGEDLRELLKKWLMQSEQKGINGQGNQIQF
jgi:hypothetical protein